MTIRLVKPVRFRSLFKPQKYRMIKTLQVYQEGSNKRIANKTKKPTILIVGFFVQE